MTSVSALHGHRKNAHYPPLIIFLYNQVSIKSLYENKDLSALAIIGPFLDFIFSSIFLIIK